jgi:hypothetical protein
MLALRGDTTPDTVAYKEIYEYSSDFSVEPLYLAVNSFFNRIGVNFKLFLFIITFFFFLFWHYLTKKILNQQFIAFISFLPFYGLYYFGIVLRSSFAILFCYLGIVILLKNKNLKGYIWYYLLIILAYGFHVGSIIFIFLPIIAQTNYKTSTLFVFLLFIVLLPLFYNITPILRNLVSWYLELTKFQRAESYLETGSGYVTYSLVLLKNVFLGGVFINYRKKIIDKENLYNFFLNTYLFGCFLLVLFSFVRAGSRLAYQFLFFEFVLLTLIYESTNLNKKNMILFIFFIAIVNFVAIIQKGNGLLW